MEEAKEELKLIIWWDIFVIFANCFPLGMNLCKGIQCFMNSDILWGVSYIAWFVILGTLEGILIYAMINSIKLYKNIEKK